MPKDVDRCYELQVNVFQILPINYVLTTHCEWCSLFLHYVTTSIYHYFMIVCCVWMSRFNWIYKTEYAGDVIEWWYEVYSVRTVYFQGLSVWSWFIGIIHIPIWIVCLSNSRINIHVTMLPICNNSVCIKCNECRILEKQEKVKQRLFFRDGLCWSLVWYATS